MKLVYAMLLAALAQALSFVQLQGQLVWKFPREHPMIMVLLGLPISYIFIKVTKLFNDHYDAMWPGRLIGFGVGIIIFTIMSWIIFREYPTPKTLTCLALAISIILIQLFWK